MWDGSNWVPDSATYAAPAFQIVGALAREYSHTDWSNRAAATGWHLGGFRASNGTQNAEVVYTVPLLREGTWSLTLLHGEGTSRGIYTIATSPDASTWTDLTTIDGYASSSANSATDSVTGLTVPSGVKFVRLKMSTKNASSSGYSGAFSGLAGARTGA